MKTQAKSCQNSSKIEKKKLNLQEIPVMSIAAKRLKNKPALQFQGLF